MIRHRAVALAAAAASLAALGLARASGGGPTLYDGLCTPIAYRALGGKPAPPSASATYTAVQLQQTQTLADDQTAPQAQIIVGAGTLTPPAGASSVTLSITPVRAPSASPRGTIAGNVYDFKAVSGTTAVAAAPDHPVTIVLTATPSATNVTLEHFDGTRWTALRTFQSGCGTTFDAASPSLGLFALVGAASGGSSGGGVSPLLIVVIVVVLLAAAIVGVRVSRGRRRRPAARRGTGRRR